MIERTGLRQAWGNIGCHLSEGPQATDQTQIQFVFDVVRRRPPCLLASRENPFLGRGGGKGAL